MKVDDCYQLGYIVKTHGLKGEVQLLLDVDSPDDYRKLESVFVLQHQQLVPFFIKSMLLSGKTAIVAFEHVHSVEEAKQLKGCALYLPLELLPVLDRDTFYIHEVIGFDLIDWESQKKLGQITQAMDSGPQLLFSVLTPDGVELLVPYDRSLMKGLNRKEKFMILQIPEGLPDIYLKDED